MTTRANAAELGRAMAERIAGRVADPAQWLIEVRRIAEALRLDVTRAVVVSGSLQQICFHLVDEAIKQSRKVEDIEAA